MYHAGIKAAKEQRIPTFGNCLKAGKYSYEDLGDRAMQGVANLLPPALGLARLVEQNASALQMLEEDFTADDIMGIKTSFRHASGQRRDNGDISGRPGFTWRSYARPSKVSLLLVFHYQCMLFLP